MREAINCLSEHYQHFLLIDLVVSVEVGILDELPNFHHIRHSFLPQVSQRVSEQVQYLVVF